MIESHDQSLVICCRPARIGPIARRSPFHHLICMLKVHAPIGSWRTPQNNFIRNVAQVMTMQLRVCTLILTIGDEGLVSWSLSHQHWVCEARTHWAAWKMSLTSSIASLFPMRWGATHTATAWYNWDTICITALFIACIDSLHGMTLTERLTALQQFDSTRSSPFEEDSTTTIALATPSSAVALSGGRWCL
jgi:hypothetical protein